MQETTATKANVEYAFRVAGMLIDDLETLRREVRVFRDGWADDDNSFPAGDPEQLRGLILQISEHCTTHDEYRARIGPALESANIGTLTPIVYQNPRFKPQACITAFEAIACLAEIAEQSCARLVFNVETDGQPRSEIPTAGSEEFARECNECEQAMASVTADELARLEALLRIEEARTLSWLDQAHEPCPTNGSSKPVLSVNTAACIAFLDDEEIGLNKKQTEVLKLLIAKRGAYVSLSAHKIRTRDIDPWPEQLVGLIDSHTGGGTRIAIEKVDLA